MQSDISESSRAGGQFEPLGKSLSAASAKWRGDRRRLTESAYTGLIAQNLIPLKNPAWTPTWKSGPSLP